MATTDYNNIEESKSSIHTVGGNEIVNVCVGQAGISMGNEFYSTIMSEHKIDNQGKFIGNKDADQLLMSKSNCFFKYRYKYNHYAPRCLFFDLECKSIDSVRSSFIGSLIDYENFVYSGCGGGVVNWAKGHYTEGAEIIDACMESVRNEAEICDNLQGFMLFHSICGGTGGGLGTLLLLKIRDNWPAQQTYAYSVFPSKTGHGNINNNFEIYNSVLSIHQLLENTDLNFQLDNGKILNQICAKKCNLKQPTYDDINWIISLLISGATSSFRFISEPNLCSTMIGLHHYHVPFPRLHFLSISNSPYFGKIKYKYNDKIDEILNNTLDIKDTSDIDIEKGKILSLNTFYRGNDENALNKMNEYNKKNEEKIGDDFVEWLPGCCSSCYVLDGNNKCYEKYTPLLITSLIHSTGMRFNWKWISKEYKKMYQRKAFLHWYKGEGMDEMEFVEAERNLRDTCDEYKVKEELITRLDNEDEEQHDEDD